jgi:hypothetical protein
MNEVPSTAGTGLAMEHEIRARRAYGTAEWLHLAATPTFAAMALLTLFAGNPMDMLCPIGGHGMSSLSGMTLMYVLMSTFHAGPWLKLVGKRNGGREGRARALGKL